MMFPSRHCTLKGGVLMYFLPIFKVIVANKQKRYLLFLLNVSKIRIRPKGKYGNTSETDIPAFHCYLNVNSVLCQNIPYCTFATILRLLCSKIQNI